MFNFFSTYNRAIFQALFFVATCWQQSFAGQIFDPIDYTQNAAFLSAWRSAINETPDFCVDFESSTLRNTPIGPVYKNLNNVAGLFPGGMKVSESDGTMWVAQGVGYTWEDVDNDNDNDLGEGPANTGLWALSNFEEEITTLDFSTSPVDYFSFYISDWDIAGKTETTKDCNITIYFTDNTTESIATDRTASSKYEFFGYYTGIGGKKIKKVTLKCYNNDSQWGLDDVCYGVVGVGCSLRAIASNTGPYCTGDQVRINLTVEGGSGTLTYNWVGPNGFTSSSQNLSRSNATINMAGNYSVTVTNGTSCTQTASTTITVNQTPIATASNTGPYCVGQTISLSATGGGTYSWVGPNGFTSSNQNPSRSNANVSMGGGYTVTVIDGGCTAKQSTNIVVNQTDVSASSNSPVCLGEALYLSASGGDTYAWTGPGGFSSTNQNPIRNNFTSGMGGTYTVTATKNGCTATTTVNVVSAGSCTPSCNITSSGINSFSCNNNGTATNEADDKIVFMLNPIGLGLGTGYLVTVSSGSVSPVSANYGLPTLFTLQSGSAGAGNVLLTITDSSDNECTLGLVIADPGSCSVCPPPSCVPATLTHNP